MSNNVEVKRLIAELYRVHASKMEMDHRISEREEEIQRLKDNMANQDLHIEKLKLQFKELGIDTPPGL